MGALLAIAALGLAGAVAWTQLRRVDEPPGGDPSGGGSAPPGWNFAPEGAGGGQGGSCIVTPGEAGEGIGGGAAGGAGVGTAILPGIGTFVGAVVGAAAGGIAAAGSSHCAGANPENYQWSPENPANVRGFHDCRRELDLPDPRNPFNRRLTGAEMAAIQACMRGGA